MALAATCGNPAVFTSCNGLDLSKDRSFPSPARAGFGFLEIRRIVRLERARVKKIKKIPNGMNGIE